MIGYWILDIGDLDFLTDQIIVTGGAVSDDEFGKESGQEKHTSEDHHKDCDMEIGVDADEHGLGAMREGVEFHTAYDEDSDEADEEHEGADKSEEMHRLLTELIEEPNGHEVEVAVDETVETEFRGAELPFAVLHHFLTDLGESGVLSEVRDIPVHLGEDLDILDDVQTVGLEAAVHIVKLDAGDFACRGIEELGRDILGELVIVPFLLPSGDEVKPILFDHAIEFRNLIGGILQVGIHGDDHIALCGLETAEESGGFAVVAAEANAADSFLLLALSF